jgi:vacuolar-type H+-ATPase subunit E/Vma4
MTLEQLQKHIISEANTTVSGIEKECKIQVDSILSEAAVHVHEIKNKAKANAIEEAAQRSKSAKAALELIVQETLASAKQESIDKEMDSFIPIISAMLKKRQQEFIKKALNAFLEIVSADQVIVKINKENSEMLKSYHVKIEISDIDGAMIKSKDGKLFIDASVEGILELNNDLIRQILSNGMQW